MRRPWPCPAHSEFAGISVILGEIRPSRSRPLTSPADLSAVEARQLISRRKLSPVELAESCIARVEAVNHAVNALIAFDFGRMMEEARAAEAKLMTGEPLGALHGLPLGVKDMNDVAGLPTTFGSEIYRGFMPAKDDAMVASNRSLTTFSFRRTGRRSTRPDV
jgi:Asp-tRNA(Asn)/Glu-tRNA(Gln) amidotransferase A subunit family amidase